MNTYIYEMLVNISQLVMRLDALEETKDLCGNSLFLSSHLGGRQEWPSITCQIIPVLPVKGLHGFSTNPMPLLSSSP
jgi:hypothetical protein